MQILKRKLSLVIAAALVFAVLLPAGVSASAGKKTSSTDKVISTGTAASPGAGDSSGAAKKDNGLQNAITKAKSLFSIPKKYDQFNYNVSTSGSSKVWYLTWNPKDSGDGSISVSIDDTGLVVSYSYYRYSDYNEYSQKKLPAVSRSDAMARADKFLKKVVPGISGKLRLELNTADIYASSAYSFNYVRVENKVPFTENTANLTVNGQTGEITNYYLNWTTDAVFQDPAKAIAASKAQELYEKNIGYHLIYNNAMVDQKLKIFLAYAPVYNSNYAIDAVTGEKVQLINNYYGGMGGGDMMYDRKEMQSNAADTSILTPQEIEAIEKVSKLISQEDAEKIARDTAILELSVDYKIDNASLSRDWADADNFIWSLSFRKDTGKDSNATYWTNVSVNAITGDIESFNLSYPQNDTAEVKSDENTSKAATEEFLKAFNPDEFPQTVFNPQYEQELIVYPAADKQRQYNFQYVRMVNGVQVPGNYLNISYDAVNNKISGFNKVWFGAETKFPAADKVIPVIKAYDAFFKDTGLELEYRTKYDSQSYSDAKTGTPASI